MSYSAPKTESKVEKKEVNDDEAVSVANFKKELSMQSGKYYYGVYVQTGDQLGAGTTSKSIYISLVGSKHRTGKLYLRNDFGSYFSVLTKKSTVSLNVTCDDDLGDVLVVIAGSEDDLIEDKWYVDYVQVANLQSNAFDTFPCYHWIAEKSSVSFTAKTTTKKDVTSNPDLLYQRSEQLKQRKLRYKWQKFPDTGIPSAIDDKVDFKTLPPDEQFEQMREFDFTLSAMKASSALKLKGLIIKVDELYDFQVFADTLGGDRILYQTGRWTTDIEFGRQILNGVNPIVIKKCSKLPSNFPVTEDMVKPFLVRGFTLRDEIKSGRVYLCDLKIMDGLKPKVGYFNVAPLCLLHVNGNEQLVPIAIQLKQGVKEEEKENNLIFLPSDNRIDWLLAKIYYQSAHSQFHQLFTHYVSCHATMEAYAVATKRNLPDPHPIFKLLCPHFRYTMATNTRARATLINKGGALDKFFGIGGDGKEELIKRCGRLYNIHTSNIKQYASERGVDDPEDLPGYHYRDDGIKVWDALEEYAGGIINEFYPSDADVTGDEELQEWAKDMNTNAFPGSPGEPDGHGFPEIISSREQLRDLCTLIMFTGSAQHAAINFQQYFYYKYVPNAPLCVRCPPPIKKGVADYQTLIDTLPDEDSVFGIAITSVLSEYSTDEIYLGDFPDVHFGEKEVIIMQERFKKALNSVSGDILQRNSSLDVPYPGMLPEKVPNSITL